MKPGNYQLVETQAPKGYQLDASPINFTIDKAQATPLQITVSNKKIESSSGGDDKPVTPPNKEENKGNETSEKHENGTSEETSNKTDNKQQDDRNTDKHLPNTGHKQDPTQTVGILLLLAGLLSILATKRKKLLIIFHIQSISQLIGCFIKGRYIKYRPFSEAAQKYGKPLNSLLFSYGCLTYITDNNYEMRKHNYHQLIQT